MEKIIEDLIVGYDSKYICKVRKSSKKLLNGALDEPGKIERYKIYATKLFVDNKIGVLEDIILALKNHKEGLFQSYNYLIILAAAIATMMAFMAILLDNKLINNPIYIVIAIASISSLFVIVLIRDKKNNQIIKLQKIINTLETIDNKKLMRLKRINESKGKK